MTESFECPSCGLAVPGQRSDYDECPYCGYEFPELKTSYKLAAVLFVILMLVFALYLM